MEPAIPAWAATYVGIPFREHGRDRSGVDCWGLLRLVLAEQFGIDVPSYAEDYATTTDRMEVSALLQATLPVTRWREVTDGGREGDGVLLRVEGVPMHVGILVTPTRFLHVDRKTAAVIDRLDHARWARRVLGIYRYER